MFLTSTNLIHYLASKALLNFTEVVDGEVSVLEVGRRNRNFLVSRGTDLGLFVKQVKAMDSSSLAIFGNEMLVYRISAQYPKWARYLPQLFYADTQRYVMVLDLVNHSESITQYHWRNGRFSNMVAELLGSALAEFHSAIDVEKLLASNAQMIREKPVWILDMSTLPEGASEGAKHMLTYMRSCPIIFDGLRSVRQLWTLEYTIHGDMKWDNCLIHPDEKKNPQIKIIDWELFGYGDRRWDIAGLMHSALLFWIERRDEIGTNASASTIEEYLGIDDDRQASLRASLHTFLVAYARRSDLRFESAEELVDLVRFVGARLVLTVYEGVFKEPVMSASMFLVLQLARVIFEDPAKMATYWFPDFKYQLEGGLSDE